MKKKKVHFFYYYYYFKQCTYILINQNSVTQKFEFEKLVLNIFLVPITFQKVYNKKKKCIYENYLLPQRAEFCRIYCKPND